MSDAKNLPGSLNLQFLESLYERFLQDPNSLPEDWRNYFRALADGNGFSRRKTIAPTFKPPSIFNPPDGNGSRAKEATDAILQERVDQLIRNYRVRGHIVARVDPLDVPRANPPELDSEFWGFTEADMER